MTRTCDVFRPRNAGKVTIPVNAKPTQDQFHLDRSRLGVHEEWDETAPNDWGGKGKMVTVQNDVLQNAVASCGDIRTRSSNVYEDGESNNSGSGPCCVPSVPLPYGGRNPLLRKKGV